MTCSMPLVTIITAVFNGRAYIEQAINSVLSQTYKNIEYIIIDGGSVDGTLDIVRKYADKITYWISEKDDGIGDAWNKGLIKAKGEIIALLNADDYYDVGAVQKAVDEIDVSVPLIAYGSTNMVDKFGYILKTNNKLFAPAKLNTGFRFLHTSCFITREAYTKVGYFNTSIRIAVDTDWLIRAYRFGIPFRKIAICNYMRTGGVSEKNAIKAFYEYTKTLSEYKFNKLYIIIGLLTIIAKHNIAKIIRSTYGCYLKSQLFFIIIKSINLIYNNLPFFLIRKLFLKLIGIKIGTKSYIHTQTRFFSLGRLTIGNNTTINSGCYLDNRRKLLIGSNVNIAHDTKIYTLGHDINDPLFRLKGMQTTIEDDVVIFANVILMPGVVIRRGAVVFPGSVVTKNVPEFTVVGGNPAKEIKTRNRDIQYKLDYGYWFAQ